MTMLTISKLQQCAAWCPCCDNPEGWRAFDKILLVAIDKILGAAGEKYWRLLMKGFPFT